MEQYCINHSTEKAVGLCGTCKSPACYRCSLTIDQVIYCSPECFNELDPPSSSSHKRAQARLDEFSDVVSAITTKEKTIHAAPNPSGSDALDSDESVILAPQMDQPSGTTLLGMSSVPGRGADDSSLALVGARSALLSSSCFFHPDTSAITLCANCRNPICTLCAKEVPGGLACSPSCGPLDLAAVRERRRLTLFNGALIVTLALVVIESLILLRGVRQQWTLAAARTESGIEDRDSDPTPLDPELRQAEALMQEAESLLREAAGAAHLGRRTSIEPLMLKSRVGRLGGDLRQAREIYAAKVHEAPDPAAVKSRIETISGLLDGLRSFDDPTPERTRTQNTPSPTDGPHKRSGD